MGLIAQHRWPLRHNQGLQLLVNGTLLDAVAAESAGLHWNVWRGEVETGIFLSGSSVVGVRVNVRALTTVRRRRGAICSGAILVGHGINIDSRLRQAG